MKTILALFLIGLTGCTPPEKQPERPKTTCVVEVEVQHEGQRYPDYPKVFIENVQIWDCDTKNIHLKADGELYFQAKDTSILIARKVMSYQIQYMRMI